MWVPDVQEIHIIKEWRYIPKTILMSECKLIGRGPDFLFKYFHI